MSNEKKVIVSFSGGKDSTVALLETLKVYDPEDILLVFIDTGAEYKGTSDHVKEIAKMINLDLEILHPKRDWFEQIRHDNMPFTPALRKCTHRLKLDVYRSWLSKYKKANNINDIITVTGIRREESSSRFKLEEWDTDQAGLTWRPCIDMREQEVKDRIKAEGLPLHYCYEFSSRCNCWCCIFAGKYEMMEYAERNPDEYEKACLLEDEIGKPLRLDISMNNLMRQGRLL